ncbi:VOC family protein [Nocardia nova]|uniref:VOC family protein n=1 Tax=Nocardia nova TaxID=37330 RepID=UPI0015E4571F|nr:VOC family protein [Nocardia nova]
MEDSNSEQPTIWIDCVTIDAANPARLADFWAQLLGYARLENFTDSIRLGPPTGHGPILLFTHQAPAPKSKNRLHLDLRPTNHHAAVTRALTLGATRVDWGLGISSWTVLADPEGNEFCILQSETDYTAFAERRRAQQTDPRHTID